MIDSKGCPWVLLTIVFSFIGCSQKPVPLGHLEGSLFQRDALSSPQSYSDVIHKQVVGVDISFDVAARTGQVDLRDQSGHPVSTIHLSRITVSSFSLDMPGYDDPLQMVEDSGGCFSHSGMPKVLLCFNDEKFLFEITDQSNEPIYSLSGNKFNLDPSLEMENPAQLTLREAVAYALKKNFDSRMEFERSEHAKTAANDAYTDLLPHLTVSTALSLLTPSFSSLFKAVGDLAPFLLPSRWFQAKATSLNSKAEDYALRLMRADLATHVEGLAYAIIRDKGISNFYSRLLERVQSLIGQLSKLEKMGIISIGSTDHIRALQNSIKLDRIGIEALVREDRIAFAQVLGLNNPDGIEDIQLGEEMAPIEKAVPMKYEDILPVALLRSLELKQLDYLIESANAQKSQTDYNWIDPSGNTKINIGFSLLDVFAVHDLHPSELQLKRQQLQALIAMKLDSAISDLNDSIKKYSLAQDGMVIQERRVATELELFKPDSGINTVDLEVILNDYITNGINLESIVAIFRVARSKVDRMLLTGFYQLVDGSRSEMPPQPRD